MASGSRQLPVALFPNDLDDWSTLLRVYDTAESRLAVSVIPTSDIFLLTPDFDSPEKWSSSGGFGHIGEEGEEGEDFYYSGTESIYRSVEFSSLSFSAQTASGVPISVNGHIAIDFVPGEQLIGNLAAKSGKKYTVAGTIIVSGIRVDFAVTGDGAHGSGSDFAVTRPDLIQRSGCSVDSENGSVTFSVNSYSYQVTNINFGSPESDGNGLPLRRVVKLLGITRNIHKTSDTRHEKGTYVRSYIVAEHHQLLVQVLLLTQEFVGVDFSEDPRSLDYRLRDLAQICAEVDDWGCPEVDVSFERILSDDECVGSNEFAFDVDVQGEANDFVLRFGDGSSTTSQQGITKVYPPEVRVEPAAIVSNDRCTVANAFFQSTVDAVPEIPFIVCPDIQIPEPVVLPEFLAPVVDIQDITINFPSMSLPSQITINSVDIPTQISIPPITFPSISVSIPDITIPPIVFTLSISVNGPQGTGPCFQFVPCEVGHCHGLS